jgi:hypothetical protein
MPVVEPTGTLLRAAALALAAGMGCALAAALLIYLGSRWIPPRVPRGEVWAQWRRHRTWWGLCLVAGTAFAAYAAYTVAADLARRDLYWVTQKQPIHWIGLLGGLVGYFLILLLLVLAALSRRKSAVTPPSKGKQ